MKGNAPGIYLCRVFQTLCSTHIWCKLLHQFDAKLSAKTFLPQHKAKGIYYISIYMVTSFLLDLVIHQFAVSFVLVIGPGPLLIT